MKSAQFKTMGEAWGRGWQSELAKQSGYSRKQINQMAGSKSLVTDTAIKALKKMILDKIKFLQKYT